MDQLGHVNTFRLFVPAGLLIQSGKKSNKKNKDSLSYRMSDDTINVSVSALSKLLDSSSADSDLNIGANGHSELSEIAQAVLLEKCSADDRIVCVALFHYDGKRNDYSVDAVYEDGECNPGSVEFDALTHAEVIGQHDSNDKQPFAFDDDGLRERLNKLVQSSTATTDIYGYLYTGAFAYRCLFVFFVDTRGDQNLPNYLRIIARLTGQQLQSVWERRALKRMLAPLTSATEKSQLREFCDMLADAAVKISETACCTVYLKEDGEDTLTLVSATGLDDQNRKKIRLLDVESTLCGKAATTGETQFIADIQSAADAANTDVATIEAHQSALIVPIQGQFVQGVIAVFSLDKRDFPSGTADLVNMLALTAASFLDRAASTLHADALADRVAFAGHALRSPLQGIDLVRNRLRRLSDGSHAFETHLTALKRELERANARIDSMLYIKRDILQIMHINRQPTKILNVLEQCADRHRRYADERRGIKILLWQSTIKKFPKVLVDSEKLDLVFDNIIENAIKYGWRNENVEIRGTLEANSIVVAIEDKGLGVPEQYREKIFEGFSRSPILDETRYISGTGIGLQLVRTVVSAHGGEVWCESTPFLDDPIRNAKHEGYKTTFFVRLPLEKEEK